VDTPGTAVGVAGPVRVSGAGQARMAEGSTWPLGCTWCGSWRNKACRCASSWR